MTKLHIVALAFLCGLSTKAPGTDAPSPSVLEPGKIIPAKAQSKGVAATVMSPVIDKTPVPCTQGEVPRGTIDRRALVTRNNVVLIHADPQCLLQVGNGEFAFGVDVTGLQTFYGNTLSQWGWHSDPLPAGERVESYIWREWEHAGRTVPYNDGANNQRALTNWLYFNPARLPLGRLAMRLSKADGSEATIQDLQEVHQELDLWRGIITSQFRFEGQSVHVETAGDSRRDAVAVRIESPLIATGRLRVTLDFPYADQNGIGDWSRPDAHRTVMTPHGSNRADFARTMDATTYGAALTWSPGGVLHEPSPEAPPKKLRIIKAEYGARDKWVDATGQVAAAAQGNRISLIAENKIAGCPIQGVPKSLKVQYTLDGEEKNVEANEGSRLNIQASSVAHCYELVAKGTDRLALVCAYSPEKMVGELSTPEETLVDSSNHWNAFWSTGGVIDFSGSKDSRWRELERRVVLSQYLMAVNAAGSLPPQESGLVNNSSWSGKFHLEMYWWHAAHYALWDRWPLWDRSLPYLTRILPQAQAIAQKQGYPGVRWPKMIGPEGRESPNGINPLLIWQQPHPIFYAELDYRAHPKRQTLEKWREIVQMTADFMASYADLDQATGCYVLGPPVKTVAETGDAKTTRNPTFELSYWRFGLRTAQQWRERLGLAREPAWDRVLNHLAPLPQQDGLYLTQEGMTDTYTKMNNNHPALVGALGMLPGDGVDATVMKASLAKVRQTWGGMWGWDYPLMAMCAARIGDSRGAVELLLDPSGSFQFNACGLPTGGPFPYLPSNGSLLYAVAMMAAGWDGAPARRPPGFPDDGSWVVRWEGLKKAL